MKFEGKTAIVTGGAQGIGRATARLFLELGGSVLIADSDEEAGKETVNELEAIGDVRFFVADVSVEENVREMVEGSIRTFGKLDILVNNAAVSKKVPVEELTLDDWNRVISVNLTGPFLFSRHAAPHLRKTRGSVVNIASTRAMMSEANTEAYSASKGGIVSLTHALAVSLGPEVRVNCVSPGWIDVTALQKKSRRSVADHTDEDHWQHPAGRVGQPEDIAEMTAYLCSEKAAFITGQNFIVDGGMTRKMIYV